MKKIWIWTIIIFSLVVSIFFFLISSEFFYQKMYLSHISYLNNCIPEIEQAIKSVGFTIGGTTTQIINQTTKEKEIIIDILIPPEFEKERLITLKHEQIHKVQFEENRIFPCITYLPALSNEIEAYINQDLPMDKFEKRYGKILEF